jgi:septal ring factor EnvC (AmiA/AmiB activator)
LFSRNNLDFVTSERDNLRRKCSDFETRVQRLVTRETQLESQLCSQQQIIRFYRYKTVNMANDASDAKANIETMENEP